MLPLLMPVLRERQLQVCWSACLDVVLLLLCS
jgi:hypothetical protein